MFEYLRPTDSLSWTFAWQSSLILAIGLASAFACRKRPARAHRALLAAMLAAFAAPALTETGRRLGWGLWDTPEVAKFDPKPMPGGPLVSSPAPKPLLLPTPERSRPIGASTSPAPVEIVAPPPPSKPFPWRSALLTAWAVASLALGLRLVASFASGARMVGRGRAVDDPAIRAHVDRAAVGLGLRIAPKVRRLAGVRCPAIWCWGRTPVLLLPEGEGASADTIDWNGVFCHELAHWSRRDHLSALAGELLVCALPWNPLAWWSRLRLGELAELACDDWVLAAGLPAADYAESLLGLAPQRQATPALAAVSSRRGLMNRLRHILSEGRRDPSPGARWTLAVCVAMLAAVSTLALAQARPPVASQESAPKDKEDQALNKTLRGTVLSPDGKALAGATVLWVAYRKPARSFVATPKGDEPKSRREILGKTGTDSAGTFKFSTPLDLDDYVSDGGLFSQVVVRAPGLGLSSRDVKTNELDTPITLMVPKQEMIHGRLLAPDGTPANGVRATLSGFHSDTTGQEGMTLGDRGDRDELRDLWPPAQTTDADGRFTIEGAPAGMYVNLLFKHPDYAVDDVTVNTTPQRTLSPWIRAFEIKPVEPTFTHTLKPARPVHGRVTDQSTGQPLAGMLVEMIPMRRHGGGRFSTRTDAEGRYRVSGNWTDGTYFTTVYPDADSGYLAAKDVHNGWPTGDVDFALEKGPLIHGRVIDQDAKRPISGASVAYQPTSRTPANENGLDKITNGDGLFMFASKERYDFSNTVITDADGRFTITGLPGLGFIAVETGSDEYMRTPHSPPRNAAIHPQGFAAVDVPKDGEPKPIEVVLRKGVSLEALVVAPDGRPVDVVTAAYLGIDAALVDVWNQGHEFAEGKFRIPGADPDRTYRVYFVAPDKHLGAVAELKYEPDANARVIRLRPTGVIRGRIASPGGESSQKAFVNVNLILNPERREYSRDELMDERNMQYYAAILGQRHFFLHQGQPDERGEFQLDAMIPGVGYYVIGGRDGREFLQPVWDLKPGEVRDLGEVKLRERPR